MLNSDPLSRRMYKTLQKSSWMWPCMLTSMSSNR